MRPRHYFVRHRASRAVDNCRFCCCNELQSTLGLAEEQERQKTQTPKKIMSTASRRSNSAPKAHKMKEPSILAASKENSLRSKRQPPVKKHIQERLPALSNVDAPKTKSFKKISISQRTLTDVRNGLTSPNTRARFVRISLLCDAVEEAKENRRLSMTNFIPDPNNMKKQLSLPVSGSLKRQIDAICATTPTATSESRSFDLGSRFRVRTLHKEEFQQNIGTKTTVVYTF